MSATAVAIRRPMKTAPINVPVMQDESTPFLLHFLEIPTMGSKRPAGNSTYLGTTSSSSGEVGDYENDDA